MSKRKGLAIIYDPNSLRQFIWYYVNVASGTEWDALCFPYGGNDIRMENYGDIPCLAFLTKEDVLGGYETNIGRQIVDYFESSSRDVMSVPVVLCSGHGVFAWGRDANEAVHNTVVVEEVARMAYMTEILNPDMSEIPRYIQDKHYFRKHGKNAYYGQIIKETSSRGVGQHG